LVEWFQNPFEKKQCQNVDNKNAVAVAGIAFKIMHFLPSNF
jgi:hypothetical protein